MKKIISIIVALALVMTAGTSSVFACANNGNGANREKTVKNTNIEQNQKKQINELMKKFKEKNQKSKKNKKNKKLFVLPVKAITKGLKAQYTYDEKNGVIVITKGNVTVTLTVGSNIAKINNSELKLDYSVELDKKNGVMIPIGKLAQLLNSNDKAFRDKKDKCLTQDLALGKTTTASSIYYDGVTSLVPANAVDGKADTRWSSAFTDSEWISIDLGTVQKVSRVKLDWEAAYGKCYIIQLSADGTNWTNAAAITDGDGGMDELTFAAADARYVRLMGLKRGTEYGYSLYNFEVYCK